MSAQHVVETEDVNELPPRGIIAEFDEEATAALVGVLQRIPQGAPGITVYVLPDGFGGQLHTFVYADDSGAAKAFANHHPTNDEVFVHPQWRRRGLATALLKAASGYLSIQFPRPMPCTPDGWRFVQSFVRHHPIA